MKNGKPVRRGCCPPVAGIYRAINEDARVEPITGTAREIGEKLNHEAGYIRHLALSGGITKTGWAIMLETASSRSIRTHRVFIAEHPDEDPIIGPVEEISALTGMSPESVRYLIRKGGKSWSGWTVRPLTDEDRGFDITAGPAVE